MEVWLTWSQAATLLRVPEDRLRALARDTNEAGLQLWLEPEQLARLKGMSRARAA